MKDLDPMAVDVQRLGDLPTIGGLRMRPSRDCRLIPNGNVTLPQVSVLILNSNGSIFTTLKRARRFVAHGLALWVNASTIRFRTEAETRDKKREIERQERNAIRDASGRMSDRAVHGSIARMSQIARLPVTKPSELLAPSPRRHFWSEKSVSSARPLRTAGERDYMRRMEAGPRK